jgi:hypothetical protein
MSENKVIRSGRNTNRIATRLEKKKLMKLMKLIERRKLANKKEKLTDDDIITLVKECHNHRAEKELNQETVEREIRAMEKSVAKYNVNNSAVYHWRERTGR